MHHLILNKTLIIVFAINTAYISYDIRTKDCSNRVCAVYNMNIIKKNKVSGIKSWFASPREKNKDLVFDPVIFWYWPMQGDFKKDRKKGKPLCPRTCIKKKPTSSRMLIHRKDSHNSLHVFKGKHQNYTACFKTHQLNQKDLFCNIWQHENFYKWSKKHFHKLYFT